MSEKIEVTDKEIQTPAPTPNVMQEDFSKFIEDYVFLLREMGTFVTTMGTTELKHPDMFELVKKFGSPEMLSEFVDKIPPEILALLFKTMVRFTKLAQIKDVMALSPQEKIDVGKEMVQISLDLSELMKKVRGY